jgi:2-polyprenyl-3-methyl-5-hydroxy-6-metoxy-1,4-benzoquinol methylase
MPNSFRIFESYAWMHYHQGKENRNGKNYEWVVSNYYDLEDWEVQTNPGEYLAFLGRITELKGMDTLKALADYSPYPIVLHGQGDPTPWSHPNIHYKGPLAGRERSAFLGNARALLAPTVFTEPFCGMAVEAMLCGTPVISVDYGAMTETVQSGMGYRCHTLQDWIDAVDAVGNLNRQAIADQARSRYSLQACSKLYDKIFQQINDLYRRGWYEVDRVNFREIEDEEGPFAHRLAGWIKDNINPSSVLDVGCGPGIYVHKLIDHGVNAFGIDLDPRVQGRPFVIQEDLFECNKTADLVLCLEVAEHIEESRADLLVQRVANMVNLNGVLIWSAAQPGQRGSNHINCQEKEYWKAKLESAGLIYDEWAENQIVTDMKKGYHMGWFANNAMVFKKTESKIMKAQITIRKNE